jgi:Flp pilus assembly protein CpaB
MSGKVLFFLGLLLIAGVAGWLAWDAYTSEAEVTAPPAQTETGVPE